MNSDITLAAIDLGASSGRVMLAYFDDAYLKLEEVHRFTNGPLADGKHLHWDALNLFYEIKIGLRKAGRNNPLSSLGVDTWGVDFALLDQDDQLIINPFHYRDPHTNEIMEQVFK